MAGADEGRGAGGPEASSMDVRLDVEPVVLELVQLQL